MTRSKGILPPLTRKRAPAAKLLTWASVVHCTATQLSAELARLKQLERRKKAKEVVLELDLLEIRKQLRVVRAEISKRVETGNFKPSEK